MTINRPNLTIKMMGRTRDATELAFCTLKRAPQAFGSLLIQIREFRLLCAIQAKICLKLHIKGGIFGLV